MSIKGNKKGSKWIPHIIRHDFLRKFFAMLFAGLICAFVYYEKKNSEVVERYVLHNVQPMLMLKEGFVLRSSDPVSLTLTLSGPKNILNKLKPEDFDIKKVIGEQEYRDQKVRFSIDDIRYNVKEIAIQKLYKEEVPLALDKIVTAALPVQTTQYNELRLPEGYYVKGVTVQNGSTVNVTGSEYLIRNIKFLTLEEIPLDSQVADFTTVAKIKPVPELHLAKTEVPVTVQIDRKIRREFKNLNVNVMLPPGRVASSNVIFPEKKVTVWVEGERNDIEALRESDLAPYVNLSNLSAGVQLVGVPVKCYLAKNGITVLKVMPDKLDQILIQEQQSEK